MLLWMRGRRAPIPADSLVFTATHGTLAMPLMFGAATVIEMVVLHLLIPWLWLSIAVAVLSIASMVAVASSLALDRVHPHVLSADALTLRVSGTVVATLDRATIVSARIHRRRGVVSPTLDGSRLVLPNQDGTTVDIELSTATAVAVPALLKRRQVSGTARSFGLQVDDATALVVALTRSSPGAARRSRTVAVDKTTTASTVAPNPAQMGEV